MSGDGAEINKGWSEAETQRLRVLVAERRTASDIAVLLWQEGFKLRSRSAVLGRVHRLGIGVGHGAGLQRDRIERAVARRNPSPSPSPARGEGRAAVVGASRAGEVRGGHSRAQGRATARVEALSDPPAFDPDRPGVPLFEARHGACKFPLRGEGLGLIVCGDAKAPGSNWCPACRPRASVPVRSVARAR